MTHEDLKQQARAAVEWARENPVEWCRKYLCVEPDAWQVELLESIADLWRKRIGKPTRFNHAALNLITVRAMHGPGKTFGLALVMHWFGFCWQTLSPCTAPKEKQLRTRLWPAFRKAMRNAIEGYKDLIEVDATVIRWHRNQDWAFVAETAATPENLQGYHDDFMLIPVDEASGVPEEMFPVLEGALSTGKLVCMVLIGNPTKNTGTFYDSHMREIVAKHYYRIHVSLEKTSRVSRDWVNRMVDKYGDESPVVQVRCYGNFATMDQLQLIALEWLVDAYARELNDGSTPRHRISVDVADGGVDASVVTIASHYATFLRLRKQKQYRYPASKSGILLAKEVLRLYDEYGFTPASADIVVDALGVGAGCAGALMLATDNDGNARNIPVHAYKGGESSTNPEMFRNRRVQSYIGARNDLRDGRVVIDEDCFESEEDRTEFEAQMCSVRLADGGDEKRYEDLETKKSMRGDNIKSPDRGDSYAMQYYDASPALTGRDASTLSVDGALLIAHSEVAREAW